MKECFRNVTMYVEHSRTHYFWVAGTDTVEQKNWEIRLKSKILPYPPKKPQSYNSTQQTRIVEFLPRQNLTIPFHIRLWLNKHSFPYNSEMILSHISKEKNIWKNIVSLVFQYL